MGVAPDTFAFVQIHHGDSYATGWGNTRYNFYGGGGYPNSWFDGTIHRLGAYPYSTYLSDYNNRHNTSTDVTMDMSGEQVSGSTYSVEATVCVEGAVSRSLRIHMVQVLDRWPSSTSYSRNGLKQGATAEDLTVAAGECAIVQRNFTFDAGSMANTNNLKIIAWAQTQSASGSSGQARVYQAAIMPWPFPTATVDAPARPAPDDAIDVDGTTLECMSEFDCLSVTGLTSHVGCVLPPVGEPGMGTCYVAKNRYLSVNPNPENDGLVTARRLRVMLAGGAIETLGWLSAPEEVNVGGTEGGTQLLSRIVAEADRHYRDWSVDDLDQPWADPTVHIGDCAIVPGRLYFIDGIILDAGIENEDNYSQELELGTVMLFGDVVGASFGLPANGSRDFKDITAVVQGFQGMQTEPKVWLDLQGASGNPSVPNFGDLSFADIMQAVAGFQGADYPYDDPCTCVGLTPCPL